MALAAATSTSSSFFEGSTRISRVAAAPAMAGRKNRGIYASATMIDSHFVLGLNQTASKQEIKRAYRSLALQYHPDVCKGTGKEHLFKEINLAYECLMKEFGSRSSEAAPASSSSRDFPQEQDRAEWLSEGYTFEDIFGAASGPELRACVQQSSSKVKKQCSREDW